MVTAELLLLSKAAMAKLAAAGSFTKDQRDKMIEKFGADSEAAVNAAMSIATAAKMAAAFMYGLDVPDFNDFMPAGGESMWSDVRKVFEKAEIGIDWGAIPDVKPAVFQTFVTIGKMKAADILKTLTEAIKHKTPCPGVTTTAALVETFTREKIKTLHQVGHHHQSRQKSENRAVLRRAVLRESDSVGTQGPCDSHSVIATGSCCCSFASQCVIITTVLILFCY